MIKCSALILTGSLVFSSCMIQDYSSEREYEDIMQMMDDGTLFIDTKKELFTLTSTRWKNWLKVKLNPSGTFGYVIQQVDLTIKVKDYPVKKKNNEMFWVELPKDLEDDELEIRFFVRSSQRIYLNKECFYSKKECYEDSTAPILIKKEIVDL